MLVARSKTHMLERTSKSSYELVDVVNPKMELRSTKSLFQNVVCVGELIRTGKKCKLLLPLYVLMVLSYSHLTKQLLIWKIHPQIGSWSWNSLSYDEMFNPSTANMSDLAEESSQMYGPYQPWGGLTPIATPNSATVIIVDKQ